MQVKKVSVVAREWWKWVVDQVKEKPATAASVAAVLSTAVLLSVVRWRRRRAMITDGMTEEERAKLAVLITGAAGGFGKALALRLNEMGLTVIATDVSPMDDLQSLDGNIQVFRMDITDYDRIKEVASELEKKSVDLWAIVNNAGLGNSGPFEARTRQGLRKECDVLFHGQLDVTRVFLPLLLGRRQVSNEEMKEQTLRRRREICANRKTNGGRIVNISSTAAAIPFPIIGCYPAMKAALRSWSHSLRCELSSRFGIWVCPIMPGAFRTPIFNTMEQRLKGIIEAAKTDLDDPNIPVIYGLDQYPAILEGENKEIDSLAEMKVDSMVETMLHSILAVNPQYEYKVKWGLPGVIAYLPWFAADAALTSISMRYP